jgi:hypothetical protein
MNIARFLLNFTTILSDTNYELIDKLCIKGNDKKTYAGAYILARFLP